jgi:hypothetical protein
MKINEQLRKGETIKIINNNITFNEVFNQMIAMKERSEVDYKHAIFEKSINLLEANQAIDGKNGTSHHSIHEAQPLRSKLHTEGMSNNLQGETIPMAYSSSLDIKNEEQDTTNNSLSSNFRLGKEIYDDNKNYPRSTT